MNFKNKKRCAPLINLTQFTKLGNGQILKTVDYKLNFSINQRILKPNY